MEMQQENNELTFTSSLLILNNHCILEVTKYLGLCDTINLSKTCQRLKSLAVTKMFNKFSEVTIDRTMVMGGMAFFDNVLSHVGLYVVNLNCQLTGVNVNYFWFIINNKCKHLKQVEIEGWNERTTQNYSHLTCFDSVEGLYLADCNFHTSSNFLDGFRSLTKFMCENSLNASKVPMVLRNNRNLSRFHYNSTNFDDDWQLDLRCLEMVPNLEELLLDLPHPSDYPIFVNLNLKELVLWCIDTNINDLLIQLAGKGLMESLDLKFPLLDARSFGILKRFAKLKSLTITGGYDSEFLVMPSFGWAANLMELTLDGLCMLFETFLLTIKQLKYLEKIDLWRAYCAKNEMAIFNDFDYLYKRILEAVDNHRDERKLLTVVLPLDVRCGRDGTQKYLINSDKLRILNNSWR